MSSDAELLSLNLSAYHEANYIFAADAPRPLPVVVITGFLGSGKTTLLQQLLDVRCNLRIAAVAHDLAPKLNVDAALLAHGSEKDARRAHAADGDGSVVGLSGCMCCYNLDTELKGVIKTSLKQGVDEGFLDYLLLETSGATDPRKLISLLEQTFGPCTRARLDRVVAVVDAELISDDGFAQADTMESYILSVQLACADLVVLNKIDLVDVDAKSRAMSRLDLWAPQAHVVTCSYGKVALADVLEVSATAVESETGTVSHEAVPTLYSVSQSLEAKPRPAKVAALPAVVPTKAGHHHVLEWSSGEGELVPLSNLHRFVSTVLPSVTQHLRRGKGFLCTAEDRSSRWEWQLSGRLRYSCRRDTRQQHGSLPRSTLVLIFSPDAPQSCLEDVQAAMQQLTGQHSCDTRRPDQHKTLPPNFEVLAPLNEKEDEEALRFRLCGYDYFNIARSVDLAQQPYSVELDELNTELALMVSSSQGGLFLGTGLGKTGNGKSVVALLWPAGVEESLFEETLKAAETVAEEGLLKRYFAHVQSCRCGH